jgi:hypothetical protein
MGVLNVRFVKHSQTSINTYEPLGVKTEDRSIGRLDSIDLIFCAYIFQEQTN